MIGGLSKALTFKNVNGSCLVDCTLNSILNSHTILVKLYSLTSESTSLNDGFITLLNSNKEFNGCPDIYKILLSAFVHDYTHNIKNIDKNKILFVILNSQELEVEDYDKIKDVGRILQERYRHFNREIQRRIDTFILSETYLSHIQHIMFKNCIKLYKTLSNALNHYKDIYIIMINTENEFKSVLDLNKIEVKVINGLFKAAITSTNEYLCTDMILYKGDDVNYMTYSHVVYYNVLDETLIDNNRREKVSLQSLIIPSTCENYVNYVETTHTYTIYVPCILHYQKITNNSKALGLTGKLSDYENPRARASRIKFIIDEVSSYTEEWYREKSLNYIRELRD